MSVVMWAAVCLVFIGTGLVVNGRSRVVEIAGGVALALACWLFYLGVSWY